MNDLFGRYELSAWKPLLTNLLLPPVPWLLLVLWGAWWLGRRRRGGAALVVVGVAGLWLTSTTGVALRLGPLLGLTAQPLAAERLVALAADRADDAAAGRAPSRAVVVLGGGRHAWAPEYHGPSLSAESLERLRYGLWLARTTGGLPVAFSGGSGWGQPDGPPEAEIAARIAATEYGQPLRWTEHRSRDTRDNARLTVPELRAAGVRHVLLVTHAWHMPRALRAFRDAGGAGLQVEAAPVGLAESDDLNLLNWMPSGWGLLRCRALWREWLGLRLGA